ncbi:MAG: MATE family efflux transporter [Patescibacteria group bacterium]
MQSRENLLAEAPINKLLIKLSVPAIVGMFVIALYNIVDTIFVGRGVGMTAITAISIIFPLYMIIMAFSQVFGVGGASLISRKLGERKKEEAETVLGNVLSLVFLSSIIISILLLVFIEPLMKIFGASEEILPLSIKYGQIIFGGLIFFSFGVAASSLVRAEGEAKMAMLSMILGSIINIILDYIFIIKYNWSVAGAAWASVLSNVFSFFYIFSFYFLGKSLLKIKIKNFKLQKNIVKEIFGIGLSDFARQSSFSLVVVIINRLLGFYGGDLAIATYGIVQRLVSFVMMPIFGLIQGMQPIVGFNYGAGDVKRVLKTIRLSVFYGTCLSVFAFFIFLFFSRFMVAIFTTEKDLLEMGEHALKIIFLSAPFIGLQVVSGGMYQAMGRAGVAFFISIFKQFLVLIPFLFILSYLFNLDGIWYAFAISDVIAFVVSFYLYKREIKLIKERSELGNNIEVKI